MTSHKIVAGQIAPNRALNSDRRQGPMALQNAYGFGSHDLHPQRLVQLVGCRDPNVQYQKPEIGFSGEQDTSKARR